VQALLRPLEAAERAQVIAELDAILEYQAKVHQGGKFVQRPPDAALRSLVPAFSAMVRRRLPGRGAPILESVPVAEKVVVRERESTAVGAAEK
jgi:hypothetical protein